MWRSFMKSLTQKILRMKEIVGIIAPQGHYHRRLSYAVPTLSEEQQKALDILRSGENVFLTGGAGSGKSFLIRYFMREIDSAPTQW